VLTPWLSNGRIGQPREHGEEGRGGESGVVAHTNDRRQQDTMFPRGSPLSSMFASNLPLMMAPLDVQMVAVSCDDALGATPCHGVEFTTINRIYGSGPFLGDYRDSLALGPHLLFSSVCLKNGHAHRVWGLYSIIPPPLLEVMDQLELSGLGPNHDLAGRSVERKAGITCRPMAACPITRRITSPPPTYTPPTLHYTTLCLRACARRF